MHEELPWKRRALMIGAGVAALLLFQVATEAPGPTEQIYGGLLGPLFASILSTASGVVPIPLAELFIAALLLRQLWGLAAGIDAVRQGERSLTGAIGAGVLRVAADAGVVVALFYLLWGFNYARPPLESRLQWDGGDADVEEVARLAQEMVEAANYEYATLIQSGDSGEPSEAPPRDELVLQVEQGWSQASETIVVPATAILGFADPKAALLPVFLNHTQTSGFYFPWTGEANYNPDTPDVSLPHVVAHEMAHQRGLAREDEANFAGYLAAVSAPQRYARYSAYVFAQRQLLSTLARSDRERAQALAAQRLPGVQRDINAASEYWAQFEGSTSRTSRSMYDAYLRRQRVPDGILSYGRSVSLLVAYARSRGGSLVGQ